MRIKNNGRKMKFLKIVIGLLFAFVLLVVVNIVAKAFEINKTLQKDYIELSANPKITQEFMTTMKYKIWISILHKYVNYDNFIMRPLFSKMDYHFKEIKTNLEQNNIDDIILWCLLYGEIYGLAYNDDNSMNFKNLDYEKLEILTNEIYLMIQRLPYGDLKIFQIQDSLLMIMLNLTDFYFNAMFEKYERNCTNKTDCCGAKLYYLDKNNLSVNKKLYSYLQDGYNKYIDKSALKDTVKIKFSQKLSDIKNFSNIVIKNCESVNSK